MRVPFVFRGSAGFDAWVGARFGEGSAGHGEGKKAFYSVSSAFQMWQFVLFERVSSSKSTVYLVLCGINYIYTQTYKPPIA